MDALFLRQVWAGNEALLDCSSRRRPVAAASARRGCTTS